MESAFSGTELNVVCVLKCTEHSLCVLCPHEWRKLLAWFPIRNSVTVAHFREKHPWKCGHL